MQIENKGVETPKTENETVEVDTITAHRVMDMELEDLDTIGFGCSILDRQDLKISNILEFHKNCEKLCDLVHILPHTTLCWINQRTDIYNRLSQTKFFEWYDSKKELTHDDYTKLERELNKDKDGISLSELAVLTSKREDELFQNLRAGCGLSIISNICNSACTEFIMENNLYVRLIPVVNENNQLEEEIRTQYLLKGNALQYLAEYWENGDIVDTWD